MLATRPVQRPDSIQPESGGFEGAFVIGLENTPGEMPSKSRNFLVEKIGDEELLQLAFVRLAAVPGTPGGTKEVELADTGDLDGLLHQRNVIGQELNKEYTK